MRTRFVDTNILLRHLLYDDEFRAPRATALFKRAEIGEERIVLSPIVVFEAAFTLRSRYKRSPTEIGRVLAAILSLPNVELPDKETFLRALAIYSATNVSFGDAYNVAFMEAHRLTEVYSWDAHYDRIAGVTRVEP
jgi:predicted nucleic acid-binding protein